MVKILYIPFWFMSPSLFPLFFSFEKNKFMILLSIILTKDCLVSIYSIKKSIILDDKMHNLSKANSPSTILFNSIS